MNCTFPNGVGGVTAGKGYGRYGFRQVIVYFDRAQHIRVATTAVLLARVRNTEAGAAT